MREQRYLPSDLAEKAQSLYKMPKASYDTKYK